MKVLVAEKISASALGLLRSEPGWTVLSADQIGKELTTQLADADALIVRSAVDVDARLLQHATRLRVIGRAGVGVDNIDTDAATKRGIAVMNTPGANAVAVAEHTFALMLALARRLPAADSSTRGGKWEKKSLQGAELRGKTLGIVGLGRVGIEVARRGKAFGMELIAHDPFVAPGIARDLAVKMLALDEVIARADYLTLHVGVTPSTTGMINGDSLKRMKAGARLINCARGELVDEAALAEALRSGHLAGAAVDVFAHEPPAGSPLLGIPNLIATPHIAGSTVEAQEAVGYQIASQVREYLLRGVIQNAVNVPSVTHEEYLQLHPYIVLAEKLGSFLAQTLEGSLDGISLRYSGAIAGWKTELIRNAAVKGVLNQTLSETANLVNAASVAEERGLRISESHKSGTPAGGAGNVISVMLCAAGVERIAKGAVLHGSDPRLLALDDIDIEAPLQQNLIVLRNRDVPGVIGRVGTILGQNSINIANFSLGRAPAGGSGGGSNVEHEALAVVQVDTPAPESVLAELRAVPAVRVVKQVRL